MDKNVTKVLIPLPYDLLNLLKEMADKIELDEVTYYCLDKGRERKKVLDILSAQMPYNLFIQAIPTIEGFLEDIIFISITSDENAFRVFYRNDMQYLVYKMGFVKDILTKKLYAHPLRMKKINCTNCNKLVEVTFYVPKKWDTIEAEENIHFGEVLCDECEELICNDCGNLDCTCQYCEYCGDKEDDCTCYIDDEEDEDE